MNKFKVSFNIVNGYSFYVVAPNESSAKESVIEKLLAYYEGDKLVVNPQGYLDACEGIDTFLVEFDTIETATKEEIEEAGENFIGW